MDIGRVLKDSWIIFSKDWGALIVASLITAVLGGVTLGFLYVPLIAGLYLMILRRVREGRKAEVGDVFGCFDRLGAYIVAYLLFLGIGLVFAVIVGLPLVLLVIHNSGARAFGLFLFTLALIAALVVGAYLLTVWIYWTILMVDRRRAVVEALKESRAIVTRSGFWMTLALFIIVGLIAYAVSGALSAVTFGVGGVLAFLVLPWQFAAYTAMYFQADRRGRTAAIGLPGTVVRLAGRRRLPADRLPAAARLRAAGRTSARLRAGPARLRAAPARLRAGPARLRAAGRTSARLRATPARLRAAPARLRAAPARLRGAGRTSARLHAAVFAAPLGDCADRAAAVGTSTRRRSARAVADSARPARCGACAAAGAARVGCTAAGRRRHARARITVRARRAAGRAARRRGATGSCARRRAAGVGGDRRRGARFNLAR